MNFQFGRNIRRLNPSKRPLTILETRGRGRSQGLSKIFRAATYRAHRAVVFAIAQLSCTECHASSNGDCSYEQLPWTVVLMFNMND